MKTAFYPGTFDPITNGHISLVRRGLDVFDRIIVGIAGDNYKKNLFSGEERLALARRAFADDDRVEVMTFAGLTVDFAARLGVNAILRGLRAVSDFEYEFQLALMNRRLKKHIQTVFLMTDYKWLYISSTIIKDAASAGADLHGLAPDFVLAAISEKYAARNPGDM